MFDSQVLVQMVFFRDQFNLPSLYYIVWFKWRCKLEFYKKIKFGYLMLVMNHAGRGQYRMGIYKKEIISIHGEHTNRVFFFFNFVLLKNWLNSFFQKLAKLAKFYTPKKFQKVPNFFCWKKDKFFLGKKTKKQNCTQGKLTCYP
jgi:hypothetical protein